MTDLADRPEEALAPRRKRSRHVALLLAGAAVLTLAGCEDDAVDAQAFPDLNSCIAAAQKDGLWFTEEDCRTQFAAAEQAHLETAPRYESQELCEQQHGQGACGADPAAGDPATAQQQGGGGFSFMPLLVGKVADAASIPAAFIVPALAYVGIAAFAIAAARARVVQRAGAAPAMAH